MATIDFEKFKKDPKAVDFSKFRKSQTPADRGYKGVKAFAYTSGGELGKAGLGAASTFLGLTQKVAKIIGNKTDYSGVISKLDSAREKIKNEVSSQKGFASGVGKVVGSVAPYLVGAGEVSGVKGLSQVGLTKVLPKAFVKNRIGRFVTKTIANAAVEAPFTYGVARATGEDKNTAKGIGAVSAVLPPVLEGAGLALGSLGKNLLKNYLRPVKSELSFGKDPVGAVNKYGIVANSAEEYIDKIGKTQDEVGKGISDIVNNEVPNKQTTSYVNITNKGGEMIDEANAVKNTFPTRVSRFEGVIKDIENFAKKLAPDGKLNIKNLWELKKFIGKLKVNWKEDEADALKKFISKMYGSTKEQIKTLMLSEGVAPETIAKYDSLNEDYGSLIGAESAAERARIRSEKGFNPFAITRGKIGAILLGGIFRGAEGAGVAALIETALEHPAVLTRLAPLLAKTPMETIQLWAKDAPWVTQLIDRVKTSEEYNRISQRLNGKKITNKELKDLADAFKELPGEINKGLENNKIVGPAYKKVKYSMKKPKIGLGIEDVSPRSIVKEFRKTSNPDLKDRIESLLPNGKKNLVDDVIDQMKALKESGDLEDDFLEKYIKNLGE